MSGSSSFQRSIFPLHKSRKTQTLILIALIIILGMNPCLFSGTEDPSLLTLERIFDSREFAADRFGPALWLAHDSGYTVIEPGKTGGDIVLYDPETGGREIIVPAWRLISSGETAPLRIEDYSWSPDRTKLLIFTNTNRGGRRGIQGDYWVLDLTLWELRKLGGGADPGTMMAARFSPDGRKVGYVSRNNLFSEDLYTQQIRQLIKDGSDTLVNGVSARLYSGLNTTGFRWSPDSQRIGFLQFDTTGVKDYFLINNTDSLYPKIIPIQHVKPGGLLPACRAGVVSVSGGQIQWLDIAGDPRNNYLVQMDWAANSQEIVIQQLNRQQNTMNVFLAEASTGSVRPIMTEKDEAWLETYDLTWINQGRHFLWVSERDGWRHIYRISRDRKEIKLLTPGNFDVFDIQSVDEEGGSLFCTASPDNCGERYLYRVPLDGSGKSERVTPPGLKGTHSYQISPLSHWAFHTYSTFDSPPVTELIRLPKHETVRSLVDNAKLRQNLDRIKRRPADFSRIDIGEGVELDGWCMKPADFDPQKRYPVLFYVYGMPGGQTVLDSWGGDRYLWHLMLTQQGYLVMSVDNRGTPAPRGRAWRKIIYRKHGILPCDDQAAALRAILKRWPYVDPSRVGVYGWSGGGLMSLLLILRYPELYNTSMPGAYLSNHRFYHASFTERFLGLPQDNPDDYKKTAALTYVSNLKGNLLLIHGTGDDNVHYQSTEALVNELIAAGKRFTMMAYPNRSHGMTEGKNTKYHLHDLYLWYLITHMPAGPK